MRRHDHRADVNVSLSRVTQLVEPGGIHPEVLVRNARYQAMLTQRQLADMAGVSQSMVCAYERGTRTPTVATLERLLAAAGLQARCVLEPLDADVDRALDAMAELDPTARSRFVRPMAEFIESTLRDIPHVVGGHAAAFLHGAPVPVDRWTVVLPRDALESFGRWLAKVQARRWDETSADYSWYLPKDPRQPGALRWTTAFGEIDARIVELLPAAVSIVHGEHEYRVAPLPDVEVHEEQAGRLLARLRVRAAAGGRVGSG